MRSLAAWLSFLASVLSTPTSLFSRQSVYPAPVACTGNCTYIHDPAVVKATDGTFYRFSTNGNIAIASAPSYTGPWTFLGAMLPQGSSIDIGVANQELWAPDVFDLDGTWHAYYSVSVIGSQASQIGLATSATLEPGSWTDHGSINLPKSSSYNLIDPNIFRQSSDASIYFSFGSAWDGIFQTELNTDGTEQSSGSSITNIAYNSTGPYFIEGSSQFWWPDSSDTPQYYLFFSSGACCNIPPNLAAPGDEYKIMVCRSPSPTGPFVDQAGKNCLTDDGGTLVLASHDNVYAPGGQGVIYDAATMKSPLLYYHYVNTDLGEDAYAYERFMYGSNVLDFESGWPVVTV